MKKHAYIFRINYLELRKPIKISETISIIPGNYELSQDEDLNFDISFQFNKYSYIFIERDDKLEFSDLKKELNLLFALISFLLSNWIDIYPQESYHIVNNNYKKIILEKAIIVPFKTYEYNKQYSRINPSKDRIRLILGEMYKIFVENSISESIYYLIGQFLISKREHSLLNKVIYAWNVLEHFAFTYWENNNKDQLRIITEEKFRDLIDSLEKTLEEYINNEVNQNDVYISQINAEYYKHDYKKLLKDKLRNGVDNFSPIKYKIIKMFENEGLNLTKQDYDLINKMNKIRNFIYHKGIEKEGIEKEIKVDPKDLIGEFQKLLEIKFWEYFRFIDKYVKLKDNIFFFKKFQISKTPLEIGDYNEKIEILKKLDILREKIENYSNKPVKAIIIGGEKEIKTVINFNYKRDSSEDSLIIDNLPQDMPSYGNTIKLKTKLDNIILKFNFRGLFNIGIFSEILVETFDLEL